MRNFEFEDFCQELILYLKEDVSFKEQVLEKDPAARESGAKKFAERLRKEFAEDFKVRVILLNLKNHKDFESFFTSLVEGVYSESVSKRKEATNSKKSSLNSRSKFESFFTGFVNAVFDALDFKRKDVSISMNSVLKSSSIVDKRNKLKSLLAVDFAPLGIKHVFVIVNYEEAANRWKDGDDFGYLRSLFDAIRGISAVVYTEKPMFEVSDKPLNSSPFWNIFSAPKELTYPDTQ